MAKKPQWLAIGPLARFGRTFGGKHGKTMAENCRDRLDATHGARTHYVLPGQGKRHGWASTQTHEQALADRDAQFNRGNPQ